MAKIDKPTDAGWEIPKNDLRASTPDVIEIDGVEYNTRICHVTKVAKWEARGWKTQKRFTMTDMVMMIHEKPQPEPEVEVKKEEIKPTEADEGENIVPPTDEVKENTEV